MNCGECCHFRPMGGRAMCFVHEVEVSAVKDCRFGCPKRAEITQDTVLDCLREYPDSTRTELAFRLIPSFPHMGYYEANAVRNKLSRLLQRLHDWGLVTWVKVDREKRWRVKE